MYAIDFEYDGQNLSDRGFMICNFDYNDGINELESGSNIVFNKISHLSGQKYSLSSTQYDECIETTFDICRIPEDYEYKYREISTEEFRELIRWLSRKEFLQFRFIEDDNDVYFEKAKCYFNASFNVSKLTLGDKLFGLRLKMITNSPFGYGELETLTFSFDSQHKNFSFENKSDEIGYIYPDLVITSGASNNNINIINTVTNKTTVINNCGYNEVITIRGEQQIISSSNNNHKIYNDFNFEFPKIQNTYSNKINNLRCSNTCTVVLSYRPIIKDVF